MLLKFSVDNEQIRSRQGMSFQPITIGRIALPNRFLMQPIYQNIESSVKLTSDEFFNQMATFYAERARYEAKLIVSGGIAPSSLGKWKNGSLSLTNWDTAQKLRVVTDAVHKENGNILAQAFHAGRSSFRRLRLAPSKKTSAVHPYSEYPSIKIPSMLMDFVVSEYERFARLAEEAGFDGVEIPLSDGSLLHNFLSNATNERTDDFGGSLDNRMELALRVVANIKNSLRNPSDFVISVRLCVHDLTPGGNSMDETKKIAEILCGSGCIDLLNTSVGMHDSPVQTLSSHVPQATFAESVKTVRDHLRNRKISTPVVASHRITTLSTCNELIENNVCDIVGLGRALLADPMFVSKSRNGEDPVPCIGCNHCVNRLYKHQRVACAVNPRTGFEAERWRVAPATSFRKNVAVVGAGAAGVMCALTLSQRGHNVILYERASEIGGQLNYAKVIPGKEDYFNLLKYWTHRLRESTVKVMLNTDFTHAEVTRSHQTLHAVALCTGSIQKPILSNYIPGASECKILVPFGRILDGSVKAGRRVVILGNGAIAFDVASYLVHDQRVSRSVEAYCVEWGLNLQHGTVDAHAQVDATKNNRDVVLLLKTEKDGDLCRGTGWFQKKWLRNHGSSVLGSALVEKIHPDGLQVSIIHPDNRNFLIPADTIVWANGMLPHITTGTWIYEWVRDGALSRGQISQDFGIYMAGTCRDAYSGDGHGEQDLLQVIHEGYEIGCKI